uniref:Glycosyltransferase family 92 protein n=1 Tax=Petromyzon marinus TaxID=7757 RepID=S4RHA0_PETMA
LTPVTGAPALLVSASWDEREGPAQARLLTIVKREGLPALRCLFCCGGASGEPFVHSPARVEVHRLHFNFPWATADVLCTPPDANCARAQFLLLRASNAPALLHPILSRCTGTVGPGEEFGVCISTLFGGYDNVLQFAQAVELYRLLGASIVTVYSRGCGPMLARLLAHYEAAGIVEVVPWPIGVHLQPSSGWMPDVDPGDVHYHGQTAALNDCLYRRMGDTRYLATTDIDEVIVPLQHEDWAGLMKALESRYRVSVFHFRNYVFPHSARDATLHATYSARWRGVPGHDILTHVLHEPPTPDSTKMMVEARRVVRVSVHSVLRSLRGQQIVPTNAARMFHFRDAMQPEMSKEQLSYDARLWRYNASLVTNVEAALSAAGLLHL